MITQIKEVAPVFLMVLVLCVGLYIYWINCPMYKDIKAGQRLSVLEYLQKTYYSVIPGLDREQIIKDYNLTDEELNPLKVFIDD